MSRFNTKTAVQNRTVNLAGGRAFKFAPETELLHAVLTTFLDNKAYESGDTRLERIKELVAKTDPQFVARLAVVARSEFNLRSVSHVLLGELSKTSTGDDLVKRAIVKATERPDDLMEVAAYVGLPMPKQVKRGIRNAILKFNRHTLAKYRGEGKEFSLVDLFNITRPKVKHATEEQRQAWDDLIHGNLKSSNTWESEISGAEDEDAKTEAWEDLVLSGKIGYMALLRNLNNLIRSDVSAKTIQAAAKILKNPERVAKSKQIPFRFLTAYNNVVGNRVLRDAVSEAMDIAVGNLPKFKGKTLIALDTSGSMQSCADKAGILAAAILKANPDADVVLYDTDIVEYQGSSRMPIVDLSNDLVKNNLGGGTNTGLVFGTNKAYDRMFIVSDNQSWDGVHVQRAYEEYKRRTIADPYVYAIDIQGYGTKDMTGGRVFQLAGFSDRVLDFVGMVEKGESMVDYVKNYEL